MLSPLKRLNCTVKLFRGKNSVCFIWYQVTLSEGPNHMAQFKGSTHQYDLTQEDEVKNAFQLQYVL